METLFAFAGGKLVVRKLAAVAIVAGVMLSATGCSFNPHPDTLQSYAPSDGSGLDINIARNEQVAFRNFFVLTNGTNYNLYGTVANSGDKAEEITIQLASDATQQQTFTVEPGAAYGFGYAGANTSTLALSGKPGTLIDAKVTANSGRTWANISIPVLDGTIDYYKNLVDSMGTATPVATASPAPSATN
jgi:hypothetical protein